MGIDEKVADMLEGQWDEKEFSSCGKVVIARHEVLRSISRDLGVDINYVEKVVYNCGAVPERYVRNLSTFSPEEQKRLFFSKVAMVGLGGLGGHLLEALGRAGVSHITACDGDLFEPSNLNRQRLSSENTMGLEKSESAFEMLRKVNPAVFLDVRSVFLEDDDFDAFIAGADVVADCLGGLRYRAALKEAAARAGIPMVTASVAGWAGIVSTVYPGDVSPADFFGGDDGLEEELGTPIPAISTAVGVQCAEILKILSGKGAELKGKAMMFDLSKLYFDTVKM